MSSDRVILVTGGGGFVGSRLAEIVYLTQFARLRVGVRSWAGAARPARFPMEIVRCDVLDAGQVADAVCGVDAVVHCAVGDRRVIVDGTRNVLEASARARVPQRADEVHTDIRRPGSGRFLEENELLGG